MTLAQVEGKRRGPTQQQESDEFGRKPEKNYNAPCVGGVPQSTVLVPHLPFIQMISSNTLF